jgi:DnaJ-class molecular chaperone
MPPIFLDEFDYDDNGECFESLKTVSSQEAQLSICPECRGKAVIELFSSAKKCTNCKGTGKVVKN